MGFRIMSLRKQWEMVFLRVPLFVPCYPPQFVAATVNRHINIFISIIDISHF